MGDGGGIQEALGVVWRRYLVSRAVADRNALIERYQPMAEKYAASMKARLPETVGLDELVSAANDGLRLAIERYDPERRVKFVTYASRPIRGAMVDYLREMNCLPRLTRRRAACGAEAAERLRQAHGREPTPEEIAEAAGEAPGLPAMATQRSPMRLTQAMALAAPVRSLSVRVHRDHEGLGGAKLADLLQGRHGEPQTLLADWESFAALMRGLLPRERLALTLYYWEGLRMREIGRALGLTESRVSQMIAQALRVLRSRHATRNDDGQAA